MAVRFSGMLPGARNNGLVVLNDMLLDDPLKPQMIIGEIIGKQITTTARDGNIIVTAGFVSVEAVPYGTPDYAMALRILDNRRAARTGDVPLPLKL